LPKPNARSIERLVSTTETHAERMAERIATIIPGRFGFGGAEGVDGAEWNGAGVVDGEAAPPKLTGMTGIAGADEDPERGASGMAGFGRDGSAGIGGAAGAP